MATIDKHEILEALARLGQMALADGQEVELLLLGGAVMVIEFGTRDATRDLDVVIISPDDRAGVRRIAARVADEYQWPSDWLNDAAKGFLRGPVEGPIIFQAPGITVRRPRIEQLLAMKLGAWRDDIDISDARRLLEELEGSHDSVWQSIKPFLLPGRELKAGYAFDDLWNQLHGQP